MKKDEKNNVHIINQNFSFDMKILYCGIELDRFHHRNDVNDRFSLCYIFNGCGEFIIKNKKHVIKQGDLFLIPPNVPFIQRVNPSNPYNYYYIAFYGNNSAFLLDKCGLNADTPVLHLNSEEIENKFKSIFEFCSQNSFSSVCKASVCLHDIISSLVDLNFENKKVTNASRYQLVNQAKLYIENNYSEDISITELCKSLYTNRTSFAKLFKKVNGLTLTDYITNYRIDKAMYFLLNTELSITAIAEQVGFKDYSIFYRRFKAKIGYPPYIYRRENNKNKK